MGISTKPDDFEKLDNISKRLKHLIDTLGIKQSHMAEKLGLSPSGLHYILNNDVKFSKNSQRIVDYLNKTEQLISKNQRETPPDSTKTHIQQIPLYYPDQLKLYYRDGTRTTLESSESLPTNRQYHHPALALYMTEISFAPKFELGDKLTFEQTTHFKDGEIILAYLTSTKSIVIKYAFQVDTSVILISLDATPIRLQLDENQLIIIGVYRECLKQSPLT